VSDFNTERLSGTGSGAVASMPPADSSGSGMEARGLGVVVPPQSNHRTGAGMGVRLARMVTESVTLAALAGAMLWMLTSGRELRKAGAAVEWIEPIWQRSIISDRLIGSYFPPEILDLPGWETNAAEGSVAGRLVWIIDPDRCFACLEAVASWNQVAVLPAVEAHVLILGPDWGPSLRSSSVLRSTKSRAATSAEIEGAFGELLPSTKLWVGLQGTILLADSRHSGQSCGWSLEAQVAAILGLGPSSWIRR
jgi:hypothetical protein